MAYTIFTREQEVNSVDIQTMAGMSSDDYDEYLRNNLLYVDHHDVLRSRAAGYPLAATKAQLKMLMSYLRELEPSIGEQ
jgi:hypothetical protein